MKKIIQTVAAGALALSLMGTTAVAAEKNTSSTAQQAITADDAATLSMVYAAMRSRVFVQQIAKDYLYIGNDVAVSKARRDMKTSLQKFDKQQKMLKNAFTDSKTKNLLAFIKMNVDEIKDTIKKPYSLDNAQEVIDLAEAISEGSKKIAGILKKKLSKDYPAGKGQRYMVIQIAKYYMAYEAGIKDENTVHQMNQTVSKFDKLLTQMKAYPRNTVQMNQILNETEKLWKIVKQFYVDIKEGGLPLIVYQTTDKIDKKMITYSHLVKKLATKK